MKASKIILLCLLALLCGCSYEEQPPRTADSSSTYLLPEGELPTPEESEIVNLLRDEYESAVK